jgi:phospholipid/cholesterol/gamma-HCH transport system permease protein
MWDLCTPLIKAMFFGATIGWISCYKGFKTTSGAEGVGRACTEAFVASFIGILVLDFVFGIVLKSVYELLYGFRTMV